MPQNWKFCQFQNLWYNLPRLIQCFSIRFHQGGRCSWAWCPFIEVPIYSNLSICTKNSNRQFINYNFSRFFILILTIHENYILSGFYSVLFNLKWLWLVHWYILYNRSLTKALLIAHCLYHRENPRISVNHLGDLDQSLFPFRTSLPVLLPLPWF